MEAKILTDDERLADLGFRYRYDPENYIRAIYPWGVERSPLAEFDGPDTWQSEICTEIKAFFESGRYLTESLYLAIASGHGIGKGALASWLIHWFVSVFKEPQIVVTANTKTQLDTKTWREVAKWHNLALNEHWLEWTATKYYSKSHASTWFAAAIPWSIQRAQAFAGTHEKSVLMIFDEASEIPDIIWETAEGAMTQVGSIWLVMGNPTMNTGRFRECFGKFQHRWKGWQIDSRTCKMVTNLKKIAEWIEDHGEDSDWVRRRVTAKFPRASSAQFIPIDIVDDAVARGYEPKHYAYSPIVIGVDVARFGYSQTVLTVRQGMHIHEQRKFRELDTMAVAGQVVRIEDEYRSDMTFIDIGAMGPGVVDRLRQIGRRPIEVSFGSKPRDPRKYANKRAEMWGDMKDWMKMGGSIPDDQELIDDLIGPEFGYNVRDQIQLEKKEDMISRGLASPDCGDSLAVTFAERVSPKWDDDDDYDLYGNYELEKARKTASRSTGY